MGFDKKVRVLSVAALVAAAAVVFIATASADRRSANTTLRDAEGRVVGRMTFSRQRAGTLVNVNINAGSGLAPGFHGFHVHANDADPNGCIPPAFTSAGGHLNLAGGTHGHHSGDLPVLLVQQNGAGFMAFLTDRFTVGDVVGRAVIVHAGSNNYGNIPVDETEPLDAATYRPNGPAATAMTAATGNAGARVLCGVIR